MNILESANIRSPNEIEEECAHFTITDTEQPFVLNEIAKPDEQYTFSSWVKGSGEISISGNKFPVTEEWTRCVITFISDSTDVEIYFRDTGEYYFYNSQLEIGEKDTDYSPAPEDLESRVTDAETVIRVQAGLIEQKVSVNGVISAINQSAEEIKISASKITLEGETIADAFTCTNLTVAGDSTFSGVLNGATGNFSGVVNATDFKLTKSGNDFKFSINTDGSQLYLGTDAVEDFTVASLILPGGQNNAVLYGYYGAEMKTDRGSIKLTTGDLGSIILTAGENVEINSDLSVSGKIINEMTNDSGWKNATLGSNFALYYSGQNVKYRKVGKVVHVRGAVKPVSDIAGSSTLYTIFTLPSGYRPSVNEYFVFQGSYKNTWLCTVDSNGNVRFSRYGTNTYATCTSSHWLPFNFSFMVD